MKRIYIAGCGGMLGDAFYKQFNNNYELKCTDIDVNENWLSYLDFRSVILALGVILAFCDV
jgi:dTDP-4-dehydrorhamnose reductase